MRTRPLAVLVAVLLVVAACGDDATDATGDTTTTTAAISTTVDQTTSTTGGTAPTPFPPANLDITHGGTTWAVVLAGAVESDDPVLGAAQQAAGDAGYDSGPTDCDEGAAEALGLDGSAYTVSVYFSSEADARQAHTAFEERGVRGAAVAQVSTFCLD